MLVEVVDPYRASFGFGTIRTVSAPAPNRVGQVFPQAEQTETEPSPFSGSVVPSWSQRSIRSVSVSRSMWIVNVQPSDPVGAERTGASLRHSPWPGAAGGPR